MKFIFQRIKTWTTANHILYRNYFRLFKPDLFSYLPNNNTDLFISSFPRSGNDYAKQLTKNYNSELRISSHFHKVGAFKLALSLGIPVVSIIREPKECI